MAVHVSFQQSPYRTWVVRQQIATEIQYNWIHTIRKLLFARTARKHKSNMSMACWGLMQMGVGKFQERAVKSHFWGWGANGHVRGTGCVVEEHNIRQWGYLVCLPEQG